MTIKQNPLSTEKNLGSAEELAFWQQVQCATLSRDKDIELAYAFIHNTNSDKAIVISSGRVESYIKYRELMFDIFQQGYSVYCVDHRGQGLSSRITSNPHQGHINKFDDYIEDFAAFIDAVVIPVKHKQLFLVGHSMGCTIGTLYMKKHPATFAAAAFSAPMFGIKLPVPECLIRCLANVHNRYQTNRQPNYIIGGHDYKPDKFEYNDLTCSKARYEHYRALYSMEKAAQLGSPTNQWLLESLNACKRSIEYLQKPQKTPVLILQAEDDTVIDNRKHLLCASEYCDISIVKAAKHEIFMETDSKRNFALTELFSFLSLKAR